MAPAPRIGTEFAGYRIDGLLGRGGMGVVYRAEHPRLGATVALKVMDPELAMNETFRERFVREARTAAQIKHPNIVPIYDAGEWHGDLYIAMRYIEGDDLRSMLRRDGALPVGQTSVIGRQVASALDTSHRNELVHRDVKPANILVEPGPDPDSPPIAYLADLGLTKQIDSQSGVTGSGELLGTIDYIAPEQINASRVDGRADVYSLACVLFECLTGAVPYVRENQAAVLWAHLHDEPPKASSVNPTVTPTADAALAKGMAKSPDDRFATARELVEALETPLDPSDTVGRDGALTRPISGAPSVALPAASAEGRRRGRIVLVLAAVLGLLLGGAAATGIALLVLDEQPAGSQTVTQEQTVTDTAQSPGLAAPTEFEAALLEHVPDEFRETCRHESPLTDDFDATLSCDPGGTISSLTYSHAQSGFLLFQFFEDGMPILGLPKSGLAGLCATGDLPAVNTVLPEGLSGRKAVPEKAAREERLGYVRCYRRAGQAHIDWITPEAGVYATAAAPKFGELYDWWVRDAGPEP